MTAMSGMHDRPLLADSSGSRRVGRRLSRPRCCNTEAYRYRMPQCSSFVGILDGVKQDGRSAGDDCRC